MLRYFEASIEQPRRLASQLELRLPNCVTNSPPSSANVSVAQIQRTVTLFDPV
jgi:hypothetical protein